MIRRGFGEMKHRPPKSHGYQCQANLPRTRVYFLQCMESPYFIGFLTLPANSCSRSNTVDYSRKPASDAQWIFGLPECRLMTESNC
jgi:hypothetical protein